MNDWKMVLRRQFGAALDAMANAIRACPDALWDDGNVAPNLFWYGASHCLFFVDLYASGQEDGFHPPPPFDLSENDPSGRMPPRTYTKQELLDYLEFGRRKVRARIESMSDADWTTRCRFPRRNLSNVELLLYSMRHVQHHTAQLNLLLRQKADIGSPWVSVAKEP